MQSTQSIGEVPANTFMAAYYRAAQVHKKTLPTAGDILETLANDEKLLEDFLSMRLSDYFSLRRLTGRIDAYTQDAKQKLELNREELSELEKFQQVYNHIHHQAEQVRLKKRLEDAEVRPTTLSKKLKIPPPAPVDADGTGVSNS